MSGAYVLNIYWSFHDWVRDTFCGRRAGHGCEHETDHHILFNCVGGGGGARNIIAVDNTSKLKSINMDDEFAGVWMVCGDERTPLPQTHIHMVYGEDEEDMNIPVRLLVPSDKYSLRVIDFTCNERMYSYTESIPIPYI